MSALVAVSAFAFSAPAYATKAIGSWWSSHERCASYGIDNQVQYYNIEYQTRLTGYAVSHPRAYIRNVTLTEYIWGTTMLGQRVVRYTGSSRTAVVQNIPESILPFTGNDDGVLARLETTWSDGSYCDARILVGT